MIRVIPSIAIRNGKVVKMRKGDPLSEKAYDENPLDLALRFQDHGLTHIHLVDLDGAEKGSPQNYHVLETIVGHTKVRVDFTGGIGTDGDISKAYEYGASQITASSIAIANPELFASWIVSYGGEKMILGADVTDTETKKIAFRGWQKIAQISLEDHISFLHERGLKYVKTTVISRDGVLEGPAFSFYEELIARFKDVKILASGGVRGVDDVRRLNEIGIYAVIIGKAFYEGKLDLKEVEKFLYT